MVPEAELLCGCRWVTTGETVLILPNCIQNRFFNSRPAVHPAHRARNCSADLPVGCSGGLPARACFFPALQFRIRSSEGAGVFRTLKEVSIGRAFRPGSRQPAITPTVVPRRNFRACPARSRRVPLQTMYRDEKSPESRSGAVGFVASPVPNCEGPGAPAWLLELSPGPGPPAIGSPSAAKFFSTSRASFRRSASVIHALASSRRPASWISAGYSALIHRSSKSFV